MQHNCKEQTRPSATVIFAITDIIIVKLQFFFQSFIFAIWTFDKQNSESHWFFATIFFKIMNIHTPPRFQWYFLFRMNPFSRFFFQKWNLEAFVFVMWGSTKQKQLKMLTASVNVDYEEFDRSFDDPISTFPACWSERRN